MASEEDITTNNDQAAIREKWEKRISVVSVQSHGSAGSSFCSNNWLIAHCDPSANLYTFSSCISFCDMYGDGDFKLLIADIGTGAYSMKLKVYKGTVLLFEQTLIDVPTGIISFNMESGDAKTPAVAVASGSYLYVYKNMKPFYKFSLPPLEISAGEKDAWNQLADDQIDLHALKEILTNIRSELGESSITARSQNFLTLQTYEEMDYFARIHKHDPLKRLTVITAITTMEKTISEEYKVNCIVIGTENKDVYILEPDAFTILTTVALPSVPVFIQVSGLYDVEYRIFVSCRDACVYSIKRGFKTGRLIVQLNSQPVGLLRLNNNIIVACMDKNIHCYTTKGNCVWSLKEQDHITAIEAIDVQMLGLRLVAVALADRTVNFYQEKQKVDSMEFPDVITSIRFGQFGREPNTLVLVSRHGTLIIEILKRTAQFKVIPGTELTEMVANSKLSIPKKTKIFVDQTMREREQYITIHRAFQHDLYRLRLTAARSYVKAIQSSLNPVTSNAQDQLKLSAQVHGLGPLFRMVLELQNMSPDEASADLFLTFIYDTRIYKIDRNLIDVPYLVPGILYNFSTRVECVSELNVADTIKVYVMRDGESMPLITAVINFPASEAPV